MNRRSVLAVLVLCFTLGVAEDSPKTDFVLEILRAPRTEAGGCQKGELYLSEGTELLTTDQSRMGYTLEPPMGGSDKHPKGSVPSGTYSGFIRVDGTRGWRIELEDVLGFSEVQLHVGNYPTDTTGCVLVGATQVDGKCEVLDSKSAMTAMRSVFQSVDGLRSEADPPKRITVKIID